MLAAMGGCALSSAVAPARCPRCGGALVVELSLDPSIARVWRCLLCGYVAAEEPRTVERRPVQRCDVCGEPVEWPYSVRVGGEVRKMCGECWLAGVRA